MTMTESVCEDGVVEDDMSNDRNDRGNPNWSKGMQERRMKLLNMLLAAPEEDWGRIKARFSMEEAVSPTVVESYFKVLRTGGYLDKK